MRAVIVEKDADGATHAAVKDIDEGDLPEVAEGGVTVAVEYSTLNYKDGLCLNSCGSPTPKCALLKAKTSDLHPH